MSGTDVPVEVEAKVCANWGQNRLVGKQEQETDFLARDLEEAVANKPTEEECGQERNRSEPRHQTAISTGRPQVSTRWKLMWRLFFSRYQHLATEPL